MIIQYASDLHLEFGMNSRYMQVYGLAEGGDVLLLAGDIGYLERRRIEQNPFFDWCSRHFREAVIVPGNHEYYRDPIARDGRQDGISVEKTLYDYEHKVRDNVRYLNNRSMVIGDIEVFATTLWTVTDPRSYVGIQTGMNDATRSTTKDTVSGRTTSPCCTASARHGWRMRWTGRRPRRK